jgi:hypothetical protein
MKPLSKLEAVYLDEFKRTSHGRPARRPTREFWQELAVKAQKTFEETA